MYLKFSQKKQKMSLNIQKSSITITILVLIQLTTEIISENVAEQDIMSTLVTDHLLRGSNNKPIIISEYLEDIKKHIQEKTKDTEIANENAENQTEIMIEPIIVLDDETTESNDDISSTNRNIGEDSKPKEFQLTNNSEEYKNINITGEIIDDVIANKTNDYYLDQNEDSVTDTTQHIDVTRQADNVATESDSLTTEGNKSDLYDETGEANSRNSIENTTNDVKIDTTTTTTTTTINPLMEEPEILIRSNVAELQDLLENSGNRNPKTDQLDKTLITEKRTFDLHQSNPHLSKSASLKSWLDDSWLRSPPGILVPLRASALTRALAVWEDLIKNEQLGVTDIVIIGYDSNGVNWRSRLNLQESSRNHARHTVSDVLHKLLNKYQEAYTSEKHGDATMKALTSASKLVPYDSALFVITDKGPDDSQRFPVALKALVEKRLKVYTIWTDPQHPNDSASLLDLQSISTNTEGEMMSYILEEPKTEMTANAATQTEWKNPTTSVTTQSELVDERSPRRNTLFDDKMEILLVKRSGGGVISVGIPVESGVNALRVLIEGAVNHAILYPPNDAAQINLCNATSVTQFSPSSRIDGTSPRNVYLVFPGAPDTDVLAVIPMKTEDAEGVTQNSGTWHLSAKCESCDYRITITAHAWIRFEAGFINDDKLHLQLTGPISSVRAASVVDEYGNVVEQLPFSFQPTTVVGVLPTSPIQGDVSFKMISTPARLYAKVLGRDFRGEHYVRLAGPLNRNSEQHEAARIGRSAALKFPDSSSDLERSEVYSQRVYDNRWGFNESTVLPYNRATSQIVNQRGTLLTAVQIGLGTKLYGAPGDTLQLHFEVTNYREQSVSFRFEAVGELRFLRGISPTSQIIAAGQTVNVIVTVGITVTAQPGARDLITFTAYGLEQVSISTYVYVLNTDMTLTDVWAPSLTNYFQGSCLGKTGDDCAQHIWSSRIVSQDSVAGLLRLTSMPIGLTYDSNFIAGTREQVLATYRATCCAPRVVVTAVDAMGNANSYVLDISSYVTPAGVAAIVLGVFLAIALIALIVFLIAWLVRRRRQSKELSYVSSTRRDVS